MMSMSGIHKAFLRCGCLVSPFAVCAALAGLACGQPAADPPPDFELPPVVPGGPGPDPEDDPGPPREPAPRSTDTGLSAPGSPLADCATPGPQLVRRLTS